jgi:type IX secretion system PorP/SprF family membrane protein
MQTFYKKILASAFSLGSLTITAQQDPMYTHYMYNTLVVNPAYAGSRDALTVTALHRSQWVSFKGAPQTETMTFHTPLRNNKLAVGMYAFNDRIGPICNTSIFGDFAYRLQLTSKSRLAFGLSAGVRVTQARLSMLDVEQENDPAFQNNIVNKTNPNCGFGIYYSRERFYAGVSVPYLFQNKYSDIKSGNEIILTGNEQRHYFLIAGTVLNISDNLAFKPTTLVKVTPAAPIEADITASFVYAMKLSLGANYRTGDSFGALIGFNVTQQLFLGYSYDWSYGLKTSRYNNGSHEIVLRYDFLPGATKQIHTPRHF